MSVIFFNCCCCRRCWLKWFSVRTKSTLQPININTITGIIFAIGSLSFVLRFGCLRCARFSASDCFAVVAAAVRHLLLQFAPVSTHVEQRSSLHTPRTHTCTHAHTFAAVLWAENFTLTCATPRHLLRTIGLHLYLSAYRNTFFGLIVLRSIEFLTFFFLTQLKLVYLCFLLLRFIFLSPVLSLSPSLVLLLGFGFSFSNSLCHTWTISDCRFAATAAFSPHTSSTNDSFLCRVRCCNRIWRRRR